MITDNFEHEQLIEEFGAINVDDIDDSSILKEGIEVLSGEWEEIKELYEEAQGGGQLMCGLL